MALDVHHLDELAPCPFLPFPVEPLTGACIKLLHGDRGPCFYSTALRYAQSLWLQGLPARSLLLINRALSADIEFHDDAFDTWPPPYAAAGWVMKHRCKDHFLGNPRRHYQHLATRMVEPRKELRSWRAWACWYLSRIVLPDFLADEKQITEEGVEEPTAESIASRLDQLGWRGECQAWRDAVRYLSC